MRFSHYFYASTIALLSMIYYAYYTQRQFYPTILFLVSSKLSFLILGNMGLALSLFIARIFKNIYFGKLRDVEVELLIERAKYTITETCLALTIFRSELTPPIIFLFGLLIFVKLLHKLSKCRLEYFEQIMPIATSAQIRTGFLMVSLLALDFFGSYLSISYILHHGMSVLFLFGFEFGLLLIYAINLTVRYVIQLVDSSMTNGLSSRGLYTMLSDLLCEVVKFVVYVSFFCLIFVFYGIPIHIMRDVWSAYSSLQRKLISFIKYLRLTKNLDSRFADATPEELQEAGACLVCREEMERGKKLPCGHIFHLDCLRTWLQHQQTCPLCRAEIPVAGAAPVLAGDAAVARAENNNNEQPQEQPLPADNDNINNNNSNDNSNRPSAHVEGDSRDTLVRSSSSSGRKKRSRKVASHLLEVTDALHQLSDTFPKFFIVSSEDHVGVYQDPLLQSTQIREISPGTIVFIAMRVSGNDGTSWLKAPDGWILENVVDSNGLFVRSNIIPLHEQNSPRSGEKTTIESIIDNQSESFKRKLFRQDSPHRPSRRELANKFLDKISSEQTKPPLQKQEEVNRKLSYDETETFTEKLVEKAQTMQRSFGDSSIKLEFEAIQKFSQRTEQSEDGTNTRKLVDLQTSLQEVAMNLADLSRSVVACQNSLSALVEDEVRKRNRAFGSESNHSETTVRERESNHDGTANK